MRVLGFFAALMVLLSLGGFGGCTVVNKRNKVDLEAVKTILAQGRCSLALGLLKSFGNEDDLNLKYLYGRALLCLSSTKQEEDTAWLILTDVREKSRKQAKLGDIDAQYRLAHMYSNASSLLLNKNEAKLWAEKAAKQEHAAAAYELSQITQGNESFKWLEYSANREYAEAQWNIGNLYANGDAELGIDINKEKAFLQYKAAAEGGFYMAFYDYAIDLITGEGGFQDLHEGQKWMMKAADNESIAAIKFFINAYTYGYCGIEADPQKAEYWRHRLEESN